MHTERNTHLLFLLSFGAMPIACASAGGNEDPTTGADNGGTTSGNSSNPTSGADDNATSANDSTASPTTGNPTSAGSTTDVATTENPTTDSPTTGASTGEISSTSGNVSGSDGSSTDAVSTGATGGTTGYEVGPACAAYADHLAECSMGDPAAYGQNCEYYVAYYNGVSAECGALNDEYVACISMADCAALSGQNNPCQTELDAIAAGCFGGGSSGGSTTGM